jgi:hypothetical protein
MQNKDANDFSHEQNNTEMSNPTYNWSWLSADICFLSIVRV